MTPVVSIIMGSTSDLPVMEKAAKLLDEMEIPFEMHALSAHRTPAEVEAFAKGAKDRGIKVIIAAAGMAAHLCGVIASMTTVPVIVCLSTLHSTVWTPCWLSYRCLREFLLHLSVSTSIKRRNPGSPDACRRRRTTPGQAGRLQGKSEEKDRKSQRRVSSGIF